METNTSEVMSPAHENLLLLLEVPQKLMRVPVGAQEEGDREGPRANLQERNSVSSILDMERVAVGYSRHKQGLATHQPVPLVQGFSTSPCAPLPSWLLQENTQQLHVPTAHTSLAKVWGFNMEEQQKVGKAKVAWLLSFLLPAMEMREMPQNMSKMAKIWAPAIFLVWPSTVTWPRGPKVTHCWIQHGAHLWAAGHAVIQQQPQCFDTSMLGERASCCPSNVLIHSEDQNISKCLE